MGRIISVIAVIGLLLLACVLFIVYNEDDTLSWPEIKMTQETASFRLEDFLYGTFEPTRFNGSWISGESKYALK